MITDIQRFSLSDGPGIRTTVFFKGCPLRCAWCHNPEAVRPGRERMLYPEKCIGCGRCAQVCPSGARRAENGRMVDDPARCVNCGACADACFTGAIQMSGTEMTAAEIVAEAMQDADYYRRSGGGVTLSGGEVLAQPGLAMEVLRLLKAQGVSTAIETSLFAEWETLEALLEHVDLVMADLKLADPAAHERWVGVPNGRILDNLHRLSRRGVPLILRTPVIPGVNDREAEIAAIAAVARTLDNLKAYELLNYNPLGESKVAALARGYALSGARPLPAQRMEALRQAALDAGLVDVRIG